MKQEAQEVLTSIVETMLEHYPDTATAYRLWCYERPLSETQLLEKLLLPIRRAGGDVIRERQPENAILWLLKWAIYQCRPDHGRLLAVKDRSKWFRRTNPLPWRRIITLIYFYGLAPMPQFPDRYRPHPQENITSILCGLWNLSTPSTIYRYRKDAENQIVQLFAEQLAQGTHTANIYTFVTKTVYKECKLQTGAAQKAWHAVQASHYQQTADYLAAIWHLRLAGDYEPLSQIIATHYSKIALDPALDWEIAALEQEQMPPPSKFKVHLSLAALYRARNQEARELASYTAARKIAHQISDETQLAIVYGYLGRYYEERDSERALQYYQESMTLFEKLAAAEQPEAYGRFAVRLAWLYATRRDERARQLLEKATALQPPANSLIQARLETAWGEYWRRWPQDEGKEKALAKALAHTHRALTIYELLENTRGQVTCYLNLGSIYRLQENFNQAIRYYQKIQTMAHDESIEPNLLAATHLNIGTVYFFLKAYEKAIAEWQESLVISRASQNQLNIGRVLYNLAEIHYTRYLDTGQIGDKEEGDGHVQAAVAAFTAGGFMPHAQLTQRLWDDLIEGKHQGTEHQLLPTEEVLYEAEISLIRQHRRLTESAQAPAQRLAAHLAIIDAYFTIITKEYERAAALDPEAQAAHALQTRIDQFYKALAVRGQDEVALFRDWHQKIGGVIQDQQKWEPLLTHLLTSPQVTTREYTTLVPSLGYSTAAKYLRQLCQLELLEKRGGGPKTYYVLVQGEEG